MTRLINHVRRRRVERHADAVAQWLEFRRTAQTTHEIRCELFDDHPEIPIGDVEDALELLWQQRRVESHPRIRPGGGMIDAWHITNDINTHA